MESLGMMELVAKKYAGKKIFVTGHTGFKGTWLTSLLIHLGANVKGYALAPEESKPFFDLFEFGKSAQSIIADIRDKSRLQQELLSFEPDFIFHLAAQPLVLRSYEIPAETFEVNVAGTANLLECMTRLKGKCTGVIITTDKVYENRETGILYQENDRLGGHDPYSASKACTELVVNSFRSSFFHPDKFKNHQKAIASARAGNVIGGGDWSTNRIIPDTAKALLNQVPVEIRNPGAVRPWQHVLEPLVGYLLLGALLDDAPAQHSTAYNFGPLPEDHLPVLALTELALKAWGSGQINIAKLEQPHEANLLKLDISSSMNELKWRPKLNAKDAIQWTMDWYKTSVNEQRALTFRQIANYLSK